MLRLTTLLATLFAVLALSATAALAKSDLWSGTWLVGSCCDDNGNRITFGTIRLTLKPDDTSITGVYAFSGGGSLTAELDHAFGPTMTGRYTDDSGKGRFRVTLQSDAATFSGWYKPCRLLCRSRPWWGERQ